MANKTYTFSGADLASASVVVGNEIELLAGTTPPHGMMRAHRGLIAMLTGILVKLANKEPLDRIEGEMVEDLLAAH